MSTRIGIYVGADWLTGIALGRRGVVWHAIVERSGDTPLESQLASLLQGVPRKRYTRASAFVALGPTLAQVKQLRGLPPIDAPRVLRQLIEAAPSRFFLMADAEPVVADPVRSTEGWWVAAADAKSVAAVDVACMQSSVRVSGMRPVAGLLHWALGTAPSGTRIGWCDGGISLDVTCGDQGIASIRRESARSSEPDTATPRLDGPLESIGGDAWRYAGAYAAARAGSAAPLMLRRTDQGHATPLRIARRVVSVSAPCSRSSPSTSSK